MIERPRAEPAGGKSQPPRCCSVWRAEGSEQEGEWNSRSASLMLDRSGVALIRAGGVLLHSKV